MTDMTDLTDVGGPSLPLLDFQSYAQRVFFPGQQGALLSQKLDVPETRRAAVEQGLSGLHKLLNNKAFLIKVPNTYYTLCTIHVVIIQYITTRPSSLRYQIHITHYVPYMLLLYSI